MDVSPSRPVPNMDAVPQRPWSRSRASVRAGIGRAAIAVGLGGVLVLLTGLAGPDGWALGTFLAFLVLTVGATLRSDGKTRKDALVQLLISAAAFLAFVPWLSILATVAVKGIVALRPNFFVSDMRISSPDDDLGLGGAGHAILGSLIMVAIATFVTLPLGILTGIYITEIRGRLTFLVRFIVQSMAGVPSVVAGLFIFTTVVRSMGTYSGLAGSLALAVLMLPTVSRTAEEVLKLVPSELRSAGYALGARQWRTTLMVVVPTVRAGLITAAILGVARIIGETAPLLLTSLNTNNFAFNPLSGTLASLPTYIFSMFVYGTEYSTARAWTGALVLMALVLAFFVLARRFGSRKAV